MAFTYRVQWRPLVHWRSLVVSIVLHCVCIDLSAEGALFTWGRGRNGRLGLGDENSVSVPTRVSMPAEKQVWCASVWKCVCVREWLKYNSRRRTVPRAEEGLVAHCVVLVFAQVYSVSCGRSFSACVTNEGDLYCWGRNLHGACAQGKLKAAGREHYLRVNTSISRSAPCDIGGRYSLSIGFPSHQ